MTWLALYPGKGQIVSGKFNLACIRHPKLRLVANYMDEAHKYNTNRYRRTHAAKAADFCYDTT